MIFPSVEPLDAVVELFEEARRRLVELLLDGVSAAARGRPAGQAGARPGQFTGGNGCEGGMVS